MMIDNNDGQSGGDVGGAHCSDKLRVNFGPKILPSPLFRATLPMRSFMKHLTRARVSASPMDQHGSIIWAVLLVHPSQCCLIPKIHIRCEIGAEQEDASSSRPSLFAMISLVTDDLGTTKGLYTYYLHRCDALQAKSFPSIVPHLSQRL